MQTTKPATVKLAVVLLATLLAPPSHGFDLSHMAFKAIGKHFEQADKSHTTQTTPIDTAMPGSTGNFGACQENFANGTTPIVPNLVQRKARALCFNGFAVLHSGTSKTPIYAAEVLNRESLLLAKGQKRTNKFFADARLPASERATLEDYRGSMLDRGHNRPAGDAANPTSMEQSFSLANMTPQAPEMNQGAWGQVEASTRKYVLRAKGNVYVITGSVSLPNQCSVTKLQAVRADCTIGNGVVVPSHFYKLVYDATSQRAWAYWMENADTARIQAPITYDELVKRTGIEFLPGNHPKS